MAGNDSSFLHWHSKDWLSVSEHSLFVNFVMLWLIWLINKFSHDMALFVFKFFAFFFFFFFFFFLLANHNEEVLQLLDIHNDIFIICWCCPLAACFSVFLFFSRSGSVWYSNIQRTTELTVTGFDWQNILKFTGTYSWMWSKWRSCHAYIPTFRKCHSYWFPSMVTLVTKLRLGLSPTFIPFNRFPQTRLHFSHFQMVIIPNLTKEWWKNLKLILDFKLEYLFPDQQLELKCKQLFLFCTWYFFIFFFIITFWWSQAQVLINWRNFIIFRCFKGVLICIHFMS